MVGEGVLKRNKRRQEMHKKRRKTKHLKYSRQRKKRTKEGEQTLMKTRLPPFWD